MIGVPESGGTAANGLAFVMALAPVIKVVKTSCEKNEQCSFSTALYQNVSRIQ